MTNIGLLPATTANQFSTSTPLSGRVLYQQASTGERSYTQVAIQFADGTAEQKNSLSNQFIEAAGQEGIAKLSATPEGQYALQIVYDHASSGGQKLMREVHEGQGNTAVDYTHKNENMCTAEAFHKEGATPEEQHLNNLMKQYGDHVSGEIPLPPSESIRLRNEIDRVSQLANPGQHNLWGDYSPQEKQYLAEQALQNRQAINNLGMWVGGPVFSALPALGRVLDAPEPVVEGLGQINAEMAGGKAFGRQGRGIQPVDTPIYSGPVKTYVLDAKSVKIEQSARVVQGQNIAPDSKPFSYSGGKPTLADDAFSPEVVNQRSAEFYKLYGDNPLRGTLSNIEARQWYLAEDAQIMNRIDSSAPLEIQARQAFDLRNSNRTEARTLMNDRVSADRLFREEPNLTWDQIVESKRNQGLSGDDVYRSILQSSQKTRASINMAYGLD
jgi:filamentous hemagglutinin